MANKKDDGYWFSLENGTHIHVGKGETPKEATDRFLKDKKKPGSGVKDGYKKETNVPYHEGLKGKIVGETDDTYDIEYETKDGIKRKDTFYKEEFDGDYDFENWDDEDNNFTGNTPEDSKVKLGDEVTWNGKKGIVKNIKKDENGNLLKVDFNGDIKNISDFDLDDDGSDTEWGKWATETDKKVPKNWESDGFDGDTRFYKVNDQKGIRSASIRPDGLTTIYSENGALTFDSLDQANEFLGIKSKQEAENKFWDDRGYFDGNAERFINDVYDNLDDKDNVGTRTNENKESIKTKSDFTMSDDWKESNYGEKSFIKNEGQDDEMFIQYNGKGVDGEEEWSAGYKENGDYKEQKFGSMEDAKGYLAQVEGKRSEAGTKRKQDLINFMQSDERWGKEHNQLVNQVLKENPDVKEALKKKIEEDYKEQQKTGEYRKNKSYKRMIDNDYRDQMAAADDFSDSFWDMDTLPRDNFLGFLEDSLGSKQKETPKATNGTMSYDQAKKTLKQKTGLDLTEDAYKAILEMFGRK